MENELPPVKARFLGWSGANPMLFNYVEQPEIGAIFFVQPYDDPRLAQPGTRRFQWIVSEPDSKFEGLALYNDEIEILEMKKKPLKEYL